MNNRIDETSAPPSLYRHVTMRQLNRASSAFPRMLAKFGALSLTALLVGGASRHDMGAGLPEIDDETGRAEIHLLSSVELVRRDKQLPPLERDFTIGLVARDYSRAMAKAHEIQHGLLDSLSERVRGVAPEKCIFGENLARHANIDAVVGGWMASDGHRRNLLEPEFDSNGIGVVRGDDGFFYVTQILAGDCRRSEAEVSAPGSPP